MSENLIEGKFRIQVKVIQGSILTFNDVDGNPQTVTLVPEIINTLPVTQTD